MSSRQVFDLKDFVIKFQLTKTDSSSPLWADGIAAFQFTGHGDEGTTASMIPEDDGEIAFRKRGALGDVWYNKNYRGMKMWSLDIGVLPQHPDEFRFLKMLEYSMDAKLPEWYIEVKNRNSYKSDSDYTTWSTENGVMVKIPSAFNYGYDTDGVRHFQFFMPNVDFNSGEELANLNGNGAPGLD